MAETKKARLDVRRLRDEEVAFWNAPYRVLQPTGDTYWIARLPRRDGVEELYRVQSASRNGESRVDAADVAEAVLGGGGLAEVTEVLRGIPSFAVLCEVDAAGSLTNIGDIPLPGPLVLFSAGPPNSLEELRAGFAEADALREACELRDMGAPDAEVEAKIAEADEARVAREAER
jgi:hypothetical protein